MIKIPPIRFGSPSPFTKRYIYQRKNQYPGYSPISLPDMGKGMGVVSDVFDFFGNCKYKIGKLIKKVKAH